MISGEIHEGFGRTLPLWPFTYTTSIRDKYALNGVDGGKDLKPKNMFSIYPKHNGSTSPWSCRKLVYDDRDVPAVLEPCCRPKVGLMCTGAR